MKSNTLILDGTADASIPVVNAHRLAELVPAAKVELFDDAGHLFWWEIRSAPRRCWRRWGGVGNLPWSSVERIGDDAPRDRTT